MATTIKVDGLKELLRDMRALGADMELKVARAGANAGAQVVKKHAIRMAPESTESHQLGVRKDQIAQPGNLKKNIIVKRLPPAERTVTEQFIVGVRHGSGKVPKDAFYWRFVEFGTVKMPARPFLRPALASNQQEVIDAMKKRIKARIDKANRSGK